MATASTPGLLLFVLFLAAVGSINAGGAIFRLRKSCSIVRFNYFYNRYEVKLKVSLGGSATKGNLLVSPSSALAGKNSGIVVSAVKLNENSARVSILCSSFDRCRILRDELISNPQSVVSNLRFSVGEFDVDSVGSSSSQQSSSGSAATAPRSGLVPARCGNGWIVFQQRVDGSLSFAQNYATYQRGFGNIRGNYWLGLDNLHSMLQGSSYRPCRLRIEVETVTGRKLKAELNHFYVYGRRDGYSVVATSPASGSQIAGSVMTYMSGSRFTTYDRDQDRWRYNCSKYYGYGGWWYKACHNFNPNGASPKSSSAHNPIFSAVLTHSRRRWSRLRKTRLSFKC